MKKTAIFIVICILAGFAWVFTHGEKQQVNTQVIPTGLPPKNIHVVEHKKLLFVPYWSLETASTKEGYDTFIYFGIAPDSSGINTKEPGFLDIPQYLTTIPAEKTLLAVRMTDKVLNESVLDDSYLQQKVISDSLQIVKRYGFAGIVLDFEASGIGFDSVTKRVTGFIVAFANAAKQQHIRFIPTLYGDVFYRARPYDVKTIAENSDEIIVMAYDFHKAGGDPGPNFPSEESNADSYTFSQMISDFLQVVPKDKLTITFGMFGYDWQVTDRGDSISTAEPLSDADIQKSFITSCGFSSCLLKRNHAGEPSVSYRDHQGQSHIVWFEDLVSAQKKIEYVQQQGIGSIAFWANGYF